jgi:hypothetical protein
VLDVIEGNAVAEAVQRFVVKCKEPQYDKDRGLIKTEGPLWQGTASELLIELTQVVGESQAKGKDWPHNARALSDRVRRVASPLRKVGIRVEFQPRTRAKRMIHIYASQPKMGK